MNLGDRRERTGVPSILCILVNVVCHAWATSELQTDCKKRTDKIDNLRINGDGENRTESATNKKANKMDEQKNETTNAPSTNDTTPKVTGFGGIFFFFRQSQRNANGC